MKAFLHALFPLPSSRRANSQSLFRQEKSALLPLTLQFLHLRYLAHS
jgi:hypothetical protein